MQIKIIIYIIIINLFYTKEVITIKDIIYSSIKYLISGIVANAASVWWYVHQGDLLVATAGASGAIFGIAGLLLCIVLLSKGHFEEITLRQLIFMMFFTLYHGFAESGVNNCAHIVGAIIGFVCGIIIFCQMKKRRAEGR